VLKEFSILGSSRKPAEKARKLRRVGFQLHSKSRSPKGFEACVARMELRLLNHNYSARVVRRACGLAADAKPPGLLLATHLRSIVPGDSVPPEAAVSASAHGVLCIQTVYY
jgi:hypothetical protein